MSNDYESVRIAKSRLTELDTALTKSASPRERESLGTAADGIMDELAKSVRRDGESIQQAYARIMEQNPDLFVLHSDLSRGAT